MEAIANEQEDGRLLITLIDEGIERVIPNTIANLEDLSEINSAYHEAIAAATIVPYVFDLDTAKEDRCDAINATTDEIIAGGFTHDDPETNKTYYFSLTTEDQINWIGLNAMLSSGMDMTGLSFRAIGESYIFRSTEDFLNGYQSGMGVKQYAIETGGVLKDRINAATTKEELEAIVDTPEERNSIWATINA